MMDSRFEIIDHPSDIGIIAYGDNYKETFENAAAGMFSVIAKIPEVPGKLSFDLQIQANDREELLVDWLNELIYLEESQKVLLNRFVITLLNDKELKAHVEGIKIDPLLHSLHRSIKAATYNMLELSEKKARVIFDV
ncbi:MAG: archease [Candidatus Margulisiibacteriota bacterium]|nr:archease [Candidatus Margulisiibacteriota bacterium]